MATDKQLKFDQLAERLRRVSLDSEDDETALEQIKAMSYEELSGKCVDFGKAHLGKSYLDMTKNPRYMSWFAETYAQSRKIHHVRFLRFIQLHVEKLEAEKNVQAPVTTRSKAMAKPRACPEEALRTFWDLDEEDEMGMTEASWAAIPDVGPSPVIGEMQHRMGEMENAIQQILSMLSRSQPRTPAEQQ